MQHTHKQVYKVAKQWEGLPSADEMAAVQRREKRLREKRRVQREAAAAGVPVPHPQQQQQQLAALPAPDSAAAAAAGEGGEDDDEPIEVVADLSVDQVGVWGHVGCSGLQQHGRPRNTPSDSNTLLPSSSCAAYAEPRHAHKPSLCLGVCVALKWGRSGWWRALVVGC